MRGGISSTCCQRLDDDALVARTSPIIRGTASARELRAPACCQRCSIARPAVLRNPIVVDRHEFRIARATTLGASMSRVTFALCLVCSAAVAQEHHASHPSEDLAVHEKFYANWRMPDRPHASCCNNSDCYPTQARFDGTQWHARRREDGQFIPIPPHKVERHRDNPDGRNHVCMPPPTAVGYTPDTVFCFSLGSGS
jgi:hypothetical protein